MRVLMTAETAGGVWQYSTDLAGGLARLGIETVLAVLGPVPSESQRALATRVPGLKLVETGLASGWPAADVAGHEAAAAAVATLARGYDVDVVQLHTPALAGLARFPVPVVAVHHRCAATWWEAVHGCALPEAYAWRTELVGSGLRAAEIVVVPTTAFGEAVARIYALSEPPRTVHHGRAPLVTQAGALHDFAFTAGRLWDEGKNLNTLDAAAGELAVPLRAAGPLNGPDGDIIFDNIHCLGALDEAALSQWLAARPVFVSAALYEPFGLAVLEAAAAGCALILSDIPTYRELWDGVALFLPPRDERAFTNAISDFVGDDFERAVMGRAARERAARFTPDAMAAQMASLYRGLLPAVLRPVLAAARAA
jgi:glycosyltransferase involved in cell wall biosynthesis